MKHEADRTDRPPAEKPGLNRGATAALVALFIGVVAAMALIRNGGPPFIDILYAEDGTQFYSGARATGLRAVGVPYAGYMHFLPRMASGIISVLPIRVDGIAAAYAIAATVIVGFVAYYTFSTSRTLLDSWPSRTLLAGAIVIPPLAGQTIANLTNLHWYLIFAAFWAVITRPRNTLWTVAGGTVALIAALSDPLTALLLPGAALAIYHYRSRRHGFIVLAMMAGLATQLLVVFGADQRSGTESSWLDLPAIYAFRVAGGLTIGDVHLAKAWQRADWSVPVVAIVAVTLAVVLAVAWTANWRRVIVVASVFNSVVFLAVPLLFRGTTTLVPVVGQLPPMHSGRYTLLPALFLVVCVAVLFDRAFVERTLRSTLTGGIAAIWLVSVIAANFFIAPLPDAPRWRNGIEAARLECGTDSTRNIEVAIAPHEGWKIRLSCADL